jgi:ubiquinone/menaquinone biosynthesis C-methylase UbiE
MAMTKFEKSFVNRRRKAKRNIEKLQQRLAGIDTGRIHDVLELGCGIGLVSAHLAENYGMRVTGTDFDPEQVAIAKELNPENDDLHFQVEDASNLSFGDECFDLVLSQNVFHHVPRWDVAVQEVSRVLRPQGYFIWLDLAFPRIIKQIFQPLVKNYGVYTWDDIREQFKECGLAQRFCEQLAHGPISHHHVVLQKTGSQPAMPSQVDDDKMFKDE